MKLILLVFIAILVAIPVLALLAKTLKFVVRDLPRDRPLIGFPVLGLAAISVTWLVWHVATRAHYPRHHPWR